MTARATVLALAALGCTGCRVEEAAVPQVRLYTIEEFLGTTDWRGGSFSPDKRKLLVSGDASGVYNAYALPVAGGEPVQLTSSTTSSVLAESYFPEDERFLYAADAEGDERHHLYVRELDGGVRDLTPGEELKAKFAGWADGERSFFVATNERDARYFDLYEYDVASYERRLVFQNDEGFELGDVSPDRRWIALTRIHGTSDSDVWLHDRQAETTRSITEHSGLVENKPAEFTRDGRALYYFTDEGGEFARLARHDLADGTTATVFEADLDVVSAAESRTGRYLIARVNRDSRYEVRLFDLSETPPGAALAAVPLPPVDGEITWIGMSRDEGSLVFHVSGGREPRDVYVQQLGESPRRLTRSLNPAIDPSDLVEGDVVRFASYDGVEIPGILYRPHGATLERGSPALVWVHGGPGGQSRVGYDGLIQYLANHGYVVYAINNRGSSGYGKTFYRMDDRRHGEADLDDVVASKGFLTGLGYVDPERIGIIGGSYGGYMVLAALAFRPEEFAVGVDIFGVANWVRTLESIPAWWEAVRVALYREMGDPVEDRERLVRISPLYHASSIRRPLLVLQGANDPRVLQVESDEMVAEARAAGATVEYLVFEDEGHGFSKKENKLVSYRAVLDFLDRHLKRAPG
jgi:dipeptidyl aminopeptidase/acylaminoacyl peptidase